MPARFGGRRVTWKQRYNHYLQSFVAAGVLPLWLPYTDTTGSTITNRGSLGSAGDGAVTGTLTLGQTGGGNQGANQAALYDGLTSLVAVTNNATLGNMTTQRWAFLINPSGLGEANSGAFFGWGSMSGTNHGALFATSNRAQVFIRTDATSAFVTTNTNQMSAFLNAWGWLFIDYDDANVLGLGRRIRLFKGQIGTVTPLTLASDTEATGTVRQQAVNLFIGNASGAPNTFAGNMDEVLCGAALWTTAEMTAITQLTGV